ncbi:hypothetical protein L1765_14020 [Microaerobacter geothermalis]|uniref:winged helix DNA-binding protein n=1 Tax=Microaerobacter geothermalis TaxID=674972 RepID=UPI001F193A83|nr:winged helix DNA-binding protein [Microaerobacter geothermalis]MCF6095076.1 hypothetical protein [Microaerobacter geothermalis]
MLSDIERKVLCIVRNFSIMQGRTPTVRELMRKTGRSYHGILEVLDKLAEERYIEWSRKKPNEIVLIQSWETKWTYEKIRPYSS